MLHFIQNDPEVPPGNLLDYLNVPFAIHHPYRGDTLPSLDQIGSLIVLGGAMGANDDQRHPFLTCVKSLIRAVTAARIPYLGVCLGGQLLAEALGAKVVSNRWEELGALPVSLTEAGRTDRLFAGVATPFTTFQWHHDSFDLPEDSTLLATSPVCPHQAFRIGENAWGVQFHPEVTETIIRDWCGWDAETYDRKAQIVADFAAVADDYETTTRLLLHNFLLLNSC